jgi:methionyl-tRNA formyltransferase
MGTPAFAVPSLEKTVTAGHEVVAVFTQPDRPKGRGQNEAMSAVKEAALKLCLPVRQPEWVRQPDVVESIRSMNPEVMIVVGYGQIIPRAILDIPPHGIINVHASLLPKYRGAAPIQWAIVRGETQTGVTTMRIDKGLDTGDMLLKWSTDIGPEETSVELGARLATAGADLLVETLARLSEIKPEPQDSDEACWAPVIKKDDGRIVWNMSPVEVVNRVRGFQPWPGCYGFLREQRFYVWRATPGPATIGPLGAGELKVEAKRLFVGCGSGSLELLEVQMEGKKRMPVAAFLNGFSLAPNESMR